MESCRLISWKVSGRAKKFQSFISLRTVFESDSLIDLEQFVFCSFSLLQRTFQSKSTTRMDLTKSALLTSERQFSREPATGTLLFCFFQHFSHFFPFIFIYVFVPFIKGKNTEHWNKKKKEKNHSFHCKLFDRRKDLQPFFVTFKRF